MAYIRNLKGFKVSVPTSDGIFDLGPYEAKRVRGKIIEELKDPAYKSIGLLKFIELIPNPPKTKTKSKGPSTPSYIIDLNKKGKKKAASGGEKETKEVTT